MVASTNTIEISRPLHEVYGFLMDVSNYLLWTGGLLKLEATDGMNVGSRLSFHSHGLGKTLELAAMVTANNGKSEFEVASVRGPVKFESRYILTAVGGGTHLTLQNRIDTNTVFRLAEPLLQSIGESKYDTDLRSLKAVLESKDKSLRVS